MRRIWKIGISALTAAALFGGSAGAFGQTNVREQAASALSIAGPFVSAARISAALPGYLGGLSVMAAERLAPAIRLTESVNLAIPETFAITRPAEKLTTTYASYFITGTSDPARPVYFGDTEIQRLGTKGTFGVLVNLAMGDNTFSFSQGGETARVVISRVGAGGTQLISEINQSSMNPAAQAGVKAGEELLAECIAPAGATVQATFGERTVELLQVAQASPGIPAIFRASLPVGLGFDPDVTTNAGKVTYTLSYNGKTTTRQSTGEVFVAGQNSRIGIQVKDYLGFVYTDLNNLSLFKEKLKIGAKDYVKAETRLYRSGKMEEYYELSSGGFLPKSMATILEGQVSVKNTLRQVGEEYWSKSESYTFFGTNPSAYLVWFGQETVSFTLYNASGTPPAELISSKLFSDVSVTEENGAVTYSFRYKNFGKLWGYQVNYNGGETTLTFRYKPSLSNSSTPLDGIRIMLDPGHGGDDPGAFGLAGKTGPAERDVNLAHALATRDALEALGAEVMMTRDQDATVSLDDRLKSVEESGVDLFLSLHHNSLVESTDANKVSGMEMYYHTFLSQKLASEMMNGLTANLNRNNRWVRQSYYRVTLSPSAPSILMELGYMSNPAEYEKATDAAEIEKAARAVADGVCRALQ